MWFSTMTIDNAVLCSPVPSVLVSYHDDIIEDQKPQDTNSIGSPQTAHVPPKLFTDEPPEAPPSTGTNNVQPLHVFERPALPNIDEGSATIGEVESIEPLPSEERIEHVGGLISYLVSLQLSLLSLTAGCASRLSVGCCGGGGGGKRK